MTQEDLAKKLNKAVISVNRWENGRGFPSRTNAAAILDIAQKGQVTDNCLNYLREVLMPDCTRTRASTAYGYPDIDRDFLFQLADGSINRLYVIEDKTYQLLYANRAAEQYAVENLATLGIDAKERKLINESDKRCFHYFANKQTPCSFCPLFEINQQEYKIITISIPEEGKCIKVQAKQSEMKGRKVYIMYLTDISNHEEK
ncbi:MAG: helix-turn-helix transcriptional regulator [Clostridia bacterium]|nr:helix-turn-helix transcriptional regulator [Clostridia bacterium]